MTATADLLAFAGGDHHLPEQVRNDAVRLLGDTLAVGAAGVGAPGEAAIRSVAEGFGTGAEARLLGTNEQLPAPSAAFVNGYRMHCLEWDAVHEIAVVHALSTVVAALGAAIDRRGGCDPDEALTALAIGVDVAAGLGVAADSPLTFFRPATAGVLGAALAVARIDAAPLDNALGIACSSAAGTMQPHVEGLETLPFQIANSARAAIVASDLAKAGFAGSKNALEGPFGYFPLFDHGDLARYTKNLGSPWLISEVSTKPFPSGRASHAALGLLQTLDLDADSVKGIELVCPPLIHRLVGRSFKSIMTPAYARLCAQWLAALMIMDGRIDPRRFAPEHMTDPELAALAGKLSLVADGNSDPNALFPQELHVRMVDGSTQSHRVAHTLGSPQNPLGPMRTRAKLTFARELAPVGANPLIFDDPLAYFTENS